MESIRYTKVQKQVMWNGISLADGDLFNSFIATEVAPRLRDEKGVNEFEVHLRSLASTGFAENSLNEILAADIPEERDWAIGEAMAEVWLNSRHSVQWPWNMERDKRTPKASLPGADLVGFEVKGQDVRLALGEVKTSSDTKTPPNVMNGRSGMKHQIQTLATNRGLACQLLKWLLPRCKGTEYEAKFNAAVKLLLDSGNKAIALFGVLIRDTHPNELDLQSRGEALAHTLRTPTTCQLIALYLPCAISDLPARISGGMP